MKNKRDREFRSPPEQLPVPEESMPKVPEFRAPDEIYPADELQRPANEFSKTSYGDTEAAEETAQKKKRVSLTRKILTAVAAATVTFSSLGLNPFGLPQSSFFGDDHYDEYYDEWKDHRHETYPEDTEAESDLPVWYETDEDEPDDPEETTGVDTEKETEAVTEEGTAALTEEVTDEETASVTDEVTTEEITTEEITTEEIILDPDEADYEFPSLDNLDPNGEVPNYGILDEEYIRVENSDDGSVTYIHAGEAYYAGSPASPVSSYEGIEYNEKTNILTLTNCTADVLNINLMGNGLQIEISGDNNIGQILIWGFHYGGSITITGRGTLTVNRSMTYSVGIYLRGEESQTCLMISNGVKLDAYGAKYAILVEATSMEKAIYYLSPLTLSEGWRKSGYYTTSSGDYMDYTIVDKNGAPLTHVKFE